MWTRTFRAPHVGRGSAVGDLDNDGRPDIAVNHAGGPPAVLLNRIRGGHWIVLRLLGRGKNRDAIGARIRVSSAGRGQVSEICGGDGFYATNERRQFVGLGSAATADSVEIVWPSGERQTLHDVSANSLVVLI